MFDGRYKLIAARAKEKESSEVKPAMELSLYDIKSDPAETQDVFDRHPEIVARLRPLLPPVAPYMNLKRQTRKSKKSRD